MARVFPGQDFEDVYNARNIYTTNIEGDDYKVRRSANDSNLDPRTNSEFQEKIIDAFSIASRIWKNKRECWKDHFRRGHKIFRYNEVGPGYYEKDLTGYHLAMNVLIQTLKTNKGEYYDPNCFCITPTDIFGDPLNTYSVLDIIQHGKVDYQYRAKKLTYDALQAEKDRYNRFRSALDSSGKGLEKALLSSVGCISRDNTYYGHYRDLSKIKNIVQWPNLIFKPISELHDNQFGIWEHEYFTYHKIPTEVLPVTDGSMRGYEITLGYPFSGESLCKLGNLQITLYTQYEEIQGFIQHTNTAPFFDLYYGETLLGRYGNGGGGRLLEPLNLSQHNFLEGSPNRLDWKEYIYPVVPGYQTNMYPPGKLTECRLLSTIPVDKTDICQWDHIIQYWDAGTQIDFHHDTDDTLVKFNIWGGVGCSSGDPWCEYPHGAIYFMWGSNDMEHWEQVNGYDQTFGFDGVSGTLCVGWSTYHFPENQSFRYFQTYLATSRFPYHSHRCGIMLGDPVCEPIMIDDTCLGPAPGSRGLFFLEKTKPFEVKPVACRCPEFRCPERFPDFGPNGCTLSTVVRCPDDPTKGFINDVCVPCVGAKNTGLVYDNLL